MLLSLLRTDPAGFLIAVAAILLSLCVHEWAHAAAATRLGDPTPHNHGRLTLNPAAHIDPLGALLFLFAGIGWAKPVPVNPAYFARPKQDTAIVALAGPLSNLVLAFVSALLLGLFGSALSGMGRFPVEFLQFFLHINLTLMAFNLLPIAPLDGSKIIQPWIPWRYEDRYADFLRVGPYILFALLLFENVLPVPVVSLWTETITSGVLRLFGLLPGLH